nr:CDP-glycerol glycerophosphotransferase family protein [Eubacterium sp.]
MIKKIGYLLFACFYSVFRVFGVDEKKVFLIATHDDSPEGNIGIVAEALEKNDSGFKCIWFTRKDKITNPINFFVKKAYHLATSGTVFLDNEFLPMAYFSFSKKVKVVQLWHGTGTIKKFGQDVNQGELKKLEYQANRNITHLIVNSEAVKKEYASAFGVPEERIYVLGLPRTDLLLQPQYLEEKRQAFYKEYPQLQGKRCILYAPTFRDDEVEVPKLHLNLDEMSQKMSKDDVLLIRLHPHVAERIHTVFEEGKWNNIVNVSSYPGVTTLLAASDMLVTDYSSIVFEYCIRKKPMIFYAYDLEQFEKDGRSFYRNYRQFVPGPVVKNEEDLLRSFSNHDVSKVEEFVSHEFVYLDGNSTKRLLELIF